MEVVMGTTKPQYQKIILDPAFPVKGIRMDSTIGRDLIYCHWHHNIEIIHVNKGRILIYINNEPYNLKKGDICIINPNQVHYGNAIEGVDSSVDLIILSYNILPYTHDQPMYQKYIAQLENGDLLLPTIIPSFEERNTEERTKEVRDNKQYRDILLRLINYGGRVFNGREIAIQGAFLELIAAFYHNNKLVTNNPNKKIRHNSRSMAILDYVDNNFTKKLTVPEMANHFCVNEDYFYRLFKSYTGQTPITFIHQLRIRYAKQLLRNTYMTISEISYQVGFSSSSYFTRLFSKYTSESPTSYRKRYNNK